MSRPTPVSAAIRKPSFDAAFLICWAKRFGERDHRLDSLRFDVDHCVLILQFSFDEKKAASSDDDAVLLEDIGRKNDVGYAGFVFEREKDEAFGGAGALPADDAACYADELIGMVAF